MVKPMLVRILTLVAILVLSSPPAAAQKVSFPPAGLPLTEGAALPTSIPATLSLPRNAVGPVPAVVIAHASAGLVPNGPEPGYVAALNEAGIATLVIDMWTPRGVPTGASAFGGQGGADKRPRAPADTLPDAFGALKFLAGNPAIDTRRIGIMGFSWGATLSFLAASRPAAARALGPDLHFAAHAGHYFVCWPFLPAGPGAAFMAVPWTEGPIQLQVGGQDDYDDADGGASCRRLIDGLPPEKRRAVTLIVHATATHAWDVKLPSPMTFDDRFSHRGRGGPVRFIPDETVTAVARSATIAFFKAAFGL
jgi:dienelactone hydrolase